MSAGEIAATLKADFTGSPDVTENSFSHFSRSSPAGNGSRKSRFLKSF